MSAEGEASGWRSFSSMLRELAGIGCIGFGGGSALIPVFQERLAARGLVSQRQLDDAVAVACITPGALPVEVSADIGMERGGAWGSLLAACSMALPGVFLLVLVMVLLEQSTGAVVTQVSYLASGALSSLLSFGGGDAYVAMADGFFVETGMLPEESFYAQLVPVANALPGSILCKVLTGAGYLIGAASGGVPAGLAVALAGFAVAISMSCLTLAAGIWLFEALEGLASFAAIKRVVGCVVSGLLLTVALGLLLSCSKAAPDVPLGSPVFVLACLLLAVANGLLRWRFKMHPLAAVLLSAAVSCLVCNLTALL